MTRALLAFLVPICAWPPARGQDWPELRGPNQDGAIDAAGVFDDPFDLRVAWAQPLGSGYSNVVVVDGSLVGTFSDGEEDRILALDAADGRELWRASFGPTFRGQQGSEDGPTATPCVRDGIVFAPGPRGVLLALDLASGRELWSLDLAETFGARFMAYGFGASPLAVGDVIYQPFGTRSGVAGVALEPSTGELRWVHRAGWLDYQNSLRHGADGALLAIDAANVAVVEPDSGRTRFQASHLLTSPDMAYPQVLPITADRYLFTYETEVALRSLDLEAGELRTHWRSRELKQCYSPPVAHGDALFGLSGTFLVGIDLDSGRRLWKSREPGARGLIVVDGHLVLLSSRGELVVAPAVRDGFEAVASRKVLERGGFTAPVFGAGRLFVRNTTGLACVEIVPRELATESGAAATGAEPRVDALPSSLVRARAVSGDADRKAALERWWADYAPPLVEGRRAHFFFRGPASDVAILGDMGRDRTIPLSLRPVPGTDLFHRSFVFEPGAAWQYSFLIDSERAVLDSRSAQTRPALAAIHGNPQSLGYAPLATESLVTLPGWERPSFLDGRRGGGGFVEALPYASVRLRTSRALTVYLPEGFRTDEGLPVLYVTGADNWFEHGELAPALDALMDERCGRALVVGLPFHVGSADRMGGLDYAQAILSEVAPLVRERYGAGPVEVALGASDDATGVLALAALAPGRFRRVAVFSPAIDPEDFALLERASALPEAAYVDWSAYETRLGDENIDYREAARRLVELLESSGCAVTGGEFPTGPGFAGWSTRLDDALALLLPLP